MQNFNMRQSYSLTFSCSKLQYSSTIEYRSTCLYLRRDVAIVVVVVVVVVLLYLTWTPRLAQPSRR